MKLLADFPPRMTMGTLWLALPAVLTLVYVWTTNQYPLDFWHHLTTGELICQSGAIPTSDTFTFTIAGQPIVNQNWLAQWFTYRLYRLGGYELTQFAAGVCYAAAIGLATWLAWARSGSARVAAALALMALALGASNFSVRPQAVPVLLFAAELTVLWRWRQAAATVFAVALLALLWTNSHGSFPLAVALPGLFTAGHIIALGQNRWRDVSSGAVCAADRRLLTHLLATLVALAVVFINPYPGRTLDYFFRVASTAAKRSIGEWQAPGFDSATGIAFFISVGLALALVALQRKRFEVIEVLLLAAFGFLAAGALRMVIWWALVLPPVLAPHLARRLPGPAEPEERSPLPVVAALLFVAMLLLSTPWTRPFNPLLPASKRQQHDADEPRGVLQSLLANGCRGRIFCPMEWGANLTWHLASDAKVFIDGRVDFYPDDLWDDYRRIGNAEPGWEQRLDAWRVDWVVWDHRLSDRLPAALTESADWQRLYGDAVGEVFVRLPR